METKYHTIGPISDTNNAQPSVQCQTVAVCRSLAAVIPSFGADSGVRLHNTYYVGFSAVVADEQLPVAAGTFTNRRRPQEDTMTLVRTNECVYSFLYLPHFLFNNDVQGALSGGYNNKIITLIVVRVDSNLRKNTTR